MAIKLISEREVNSSEYGVYSHKLPGPVWLVGGASNTGGAVLRQLFTDDELVALTARMDIDTPTGTAYVVLPAVGELFPVRDPDLAPMLEPRPEDDAVFLQGIFEAMSKTEATAYALLERLGGDGRDGDQDGRRRGPERQVDEPAGAGAGGRGGRLGRGVRGGVVRRGVVG